jgi:D-beta-D-heptose 7-phosphate kinase/D-beta-D-heptose 1-phosphate adenosyltransferase
MRTNRKILSRKDLAKQVEALKKEGKRIIFTNGCFDILHIGHVKYLEQAKALGDILILALNSDASVRSIKGSSRPIVLQEERAYILASLEVVDYVIIFDEDTPLALIEDIEPDILVKGGDWDQETVVGGASVKQRGGRVVIIPQVRGTATDLSASTTSMINRIVKRYTEGS